MLAFYTTKPEGTGLGLAISKQIVERHGGRIRLESDPGRGTRVIPDFPILGGDPDGVVASAG